MIDKLAIDIDGCLNYLNEALGTIIERDFNHKVPMNTWNMLSHININSSSEIIEFWRKYDPELHEQHAEPYAKDVLKVFSKYGTEIYIVTARGYCSADITEKWLNREDVTYDYLYFNSGNKVDVCKWKNIKYMIEDNSDNALALANENIIVFLVDRPYNENVKHDNIIRCYSWLDIFEKINKIE